MLLTETCNIFSRNQAYITYKTDKVGNIMFRLIKPSLDNWKHNVDVPSQKKK